MGVKLGRSAIDKIGERLKAEDELDGATFDKLQSFFREAEPFADEVFASIEEVIRSASSLAESRRYAITRRRVKTITSIREKLRRQTTKLSQMQDIYGCRIVVDDLRQQDAALDLLCRRFGSAASVVDRREKPSHGYRAIHVILSKDAFRFEVQVRTVAQDVWANIVEKAADIHGIEVKYGGGSPELRAILISLSQDSLDLDQNWNEAVISLESGDVAAATGAIGRAKELVDRMPRLVAQLGGLQ